MGVRRACGQDDTPTHPVEAKAPILSGEISIRCNGQDALYRPGKGFQLGRAVPHTGRHGPQGVSSLVGRK